MSHVKGYILDYKPQSKTRTLLGQVEQVLEDYGAYLPLALRQVYYRLVAAFSYPKTDRAYDTLSYHVSNARRAGVISWDAIRDDGVSGRPPQHWRDGDHFWSVIRGAAEVATLDTLATQAVHLEVWCEAAGMIPQLRRVADQYSVPVFSCGGFDSVTAKHEIADRIVTRGKDAVILHLGDFDPDGECIYDVIRDDVQAFLVIDAPEIATTWERVALLEEQVVDLDLPTQPPKASSSRTKNWRGSFTCQLEALPPDMVARLLDDAIRRHLDMEAVRDRRAAQEQFRQDLLALIPGEDM